MIYLLDIDGTLLLTGGAGNQALERAFAELHGVAGAMASVRPAGKTDPGIVTEAFLAALGRPPTRGEVEALLTRYLAYLPDTLARATRFRRLPGAREAMERLAAAGHCLGVATGNVREAARLKLERAELAGLVRFGGYGDDAPERARIVAVAAERAAGCLGRAVSPAEVVVVGDTARDVAAARANGFAVIAVASGTVPREELEAAEPDRVVESLLALSESSSGRDTR